MTTVTTEKKAAPWVFGTSDGRHMGVAVEGDLLTTEAAMVRGGLDWDVQLRNARSDDEDAIKADGWKQVVREFGYADDSCIVPIWKTLGMVKGRYTVMQNTVAFRFFDRVTVSGAATIRGVGHLDYGAKVWIIAERPHSMELYPGEEIREHLILETSHDGSSAVCVRFAPYRVSTGTMLNVAMTAGRSEVRLRHTKSIEDKLETVEQILEKESNFFDRWRAALLGTEESEGLGQHLVTKVEIDKVVEKLFPAKKKKQEDGSFEYVLSAKAEKARDLIRDRVEEQKKARITATEGAGQQAPQDTTSLDVFLGVSEYVAKDRKTRKEGSAWVVSTFGTGADLRQTAFDVINGL